MRNNYLIVSCILISFLACEPTNENAQLVEYLKANERFFKPSNTSLIDVEFTLENERVVLSFESISREEYFKYILDSKIPLRFERDSVSFNDRLSTEYVWNEDTLILRSKGSRLWTYSIPEGLESRSEYNVIGEIGSYYVIYVKEFEDWFLWLINKSDGVQKHSYDFPVYAVNESRNQLLYADGLTHHYMDSTRLYLIEANSSRLDTLISSDIDWGFFRSFFISDNQVVFIYQENAGYEYPGDRNRYSYVLMTVHEKAD